MNCPVCGSGAVVAKTCIDDYVERVQQGTDPYDLIYDENPVAQCRACGSSFKVAEQTDGQEK